MSSNSCEECIYLEQCSNKCVFDINGVLTVCPAQGEQYCCRLHRGNTSVISDKGCPQRETQYKW